MVNKKYQNPIIHGDIDGGWGRGMSAPPPPHPEGGGKNILTLPIFTLWPTPRPSRYHQNA